MTRIIVAHRPETIRACDRAIVLEEGRVANAAPAEHTGNLIQFRPATIGFTEYVS